VGRERPVKVCSCTQGTVQAPTRPRATARVAGFEKHLGVECWEDLLVDGHG
jgi:hypothetical protein